MPTESALRKNISEFSGIDARSTDYNRNERFAKDATNFELLKNGSIANRRGVHGRCKCPIEFGGIQNYVREYNGTTTEELVILGEDLYRVKQGEILIDYVGGPATATAWVEIVPVDNGNESYTVRCRAYDGTSPAPLQLDMDLGVGFDEASVVTVNDLVSAINATGGHNCTLVSGDGSQPAAFIKYLPKTNTNPDLTIYFYYLEEVFCPNAAPFATWIGDIDISDTFENAALLNHAGNLYIATGFNKLYKYDGIACYAAGLAAATGVSAAVGSATGLTGDYTWGITYEYADPNGNIIESDLSNEVSLTLANQKGDITIPNLQLASEVNTCYAYANNGGTQTGTTLTVDDGSGGNHTLKTGQTAFFRDNAGDLQERLITAVAATTITIEGAAVTIANNAVISADLKINLWRNAAGGSAKYLVRQFANDPVNASFVYNDSVADASLGAEYEEPAVGHAPPPDNLRYLTAYNSGLVGATGLDDYVHYSDYDGPEYFPTDFSTLRIRSKSNHRITGVAANRELLLVQKTDESHAIVGDLPETKYRQEIVADDLGVDSYHSIIDVDGTLWFLSQNYGVRRCTGLEMPADLSYRVLPLLTKAQAQESDTFRFDKAIGVVVPRRQQAIFYVPIMTTTSGYRHPTEDSIVMVADYRSQAEADAEYDEDGRIVAMFPKVKWWKWSGLNMLGGACIFEDRVFFLERRYSEVNAENEYFISELLESNNQYDFTDHAGPQTSEYQAGWQHFNEPEQLKKWIGASIYSYPEQGSASATVKVSVEGNFRNDKPVSRKEIEFGAGAMSVGWGEPWDTTAFGSPTATRKRFEFVPFTSVAAKLKFNANTFCEQAVISGWTMEVVPALKPKIKNK